MTTLRYTGTVPMTIPALGVHVEPDGLVEVAEPAASELIARDDWKRATAAPVETVASIKAAVGDDAEMAAAALVEELAQSSPRPTLVAHLEQVAGTQHIDPEE